MCCDRLEFLSIFGIVSSQFGPADIMGCGWHLEGKKQESGQFPETEMTGLKSIQAHGKFRRKE